VAPSAAPTATRLNWGRNLTSAFNRRVTNQVTGQFGCGMAERGESLEREEIKKAQRGDHEEQVEREAERHADQSARERSRTGKLKERRESGGPA